MKRLLSYAAGCLLVLLAAAPTLAQDGPWVNVSDSPHLQGGYAIATSIQSPIDNVVWSLVNLDAGMGYNTTKVMSSADNGATWRDTVNFTSRLSVTDLWALDGQRAWIIRGGQTLWQTSKGPTGFKPSPTQVATSSRFIRFFTPMVGVLIGYKASALGNLTIYCTTDGGVSWQLQANTLSFTVATYATQCTILGTDIWVTTSQAQLLHSSDAGLTWTLTTTPIGFSQVSFRDAQHGLAYGPKNEFIQGQPLTPHHYIELTTAEPPGIF